MTIPAFPKDKSALDAQYQNIRWLPGTGLAPEALAAGIEAIAADRAVPLAIRRAKMFAFLLEHAELAYDEGDVFQDKINAVGLLGRYTWKWEGEAFARSLDGSLLDERSAGSKAYVFAANADYGHISPNTDALLMLGFPGLLARLRYERQNKTRLTEEQEIFYDSCEITLRAILSLIVRLSDAVRTEDPAAGECLAHLAVSAPANTYEALELLYLYFTLHERISGARVRTLGRLDVSMQPFYEADLAAGTFTKGEIADLYRYFLNKFWAAKVPFDQPMMIGGSDGYGRDLTGELTELILEAFDSLNIHSPKLHIRVAENTPDAFLTRVLTCIRGGNSSMVLLNEEKAIEGLERIGVDPDDAKKVVLIGCYESAVGGVEVPCTGNGTVNLAKALSFVFTHGFDAETGKQIGLDTGVPETFGAFVDAVKAQFRFLAEKAMKIIRAVEPLYPEIYPDALLSCQLDACVERGVNAYASGAKYNNSSLTSMGVATLTDSLAAVKRLVYDEKRLTLSELGEILKNDWAGSESLRAEVLRFPEKYGNGIEEVDALAVDFAAFISKTITGQPNGRGGVFKAGLFSIDHCYSYGAHTMATPDGRHAGDPLSKNLCPVTAMDRNGVTAALRSAAKFDHAGFPNGTVFDFVLHPTAVSGDDGLAALLGLVRAYFKEGGFAIHGNIFDSAVLREAVAHPESYSTLQVRLCGWNVYFVNLTRREQEDFIRQSEAH